MGFSITNDQGRIIRRWERGAVTKIRIRNHAALLAYEDKYHFLKEGKSVDVTEIIPFANGTSIEELVCDIFPDKEGLPLDEDGRWKNPVCVINSNHMTTIGCLDICKKARSFLEEVDSTMDILSIRSRMQADKLVLSFVVRIYGKEPSFKDLFSYLGEMEVVEEKPQDPLGRIEMKRDFSKEEIRIHRESRKEQDEKFYAASEEIPFLNSIEKYVPMQLSASKEELVYDLLTKDMQTKTILSYDQFIKIFKKCVTYLSTVEKDTYFGVIRESIEMSSFEMLVDNYINQYFVIPGSLPREDIHALKEKLHQALFGFYIIEDLIEDKKITDIKITSPDSVRVRVNGKAYLSNINFIDDADYDRFVRSIAVKNNINLKMPVQTFTDERDEDYLLRFSITSPYVTSTGYPIIHIRKVARKKMLGSDLMKAGMMDEKIRDYLLDCGKNSRGVVFAGPPGSGKTVALNWFLEEAYESEAEILVIQENDELFAYRKGVMIEHVVNNPQKGEMACSLEDLGQMALVAGANVFVIGEAKGGEICSAITLSNSGCRTALTIHSPSATETIDKMADLAMRGYADSYEQAKRMIKSFETIVYLQDFKVQEISQITGFDEATKDMKYRCIYRRGV